MTAAPYTPNFSPNMSMAWFRDGSWEPASISGVAPLPLHPAAHVLHFASCVFDGLKAYRSVEGEVRIFRLDRHVQRMRNSARALCLPVPEETGLSSMIREVVAANREDVPESPKALYIRPILIGTSPVIAGSATTAVEACLYVLTSPVGGLFGGGGALRIAIDDQHARATPQLGAAKAGANYAAGIGPIMAAKQAYGVDQLLFAPDGYPQEAGGAGFMLLRDGEIMARDVDDSFLPSVTRETLLTLAPELGYKATLRGFTIDETLNWIKDGEAALCGTAAVLTGIGTFIYKEREYTVGNGEEGPNTARVRSALADIQTGKAEDRYGWLTTV